jgi:hypothetical protein
MFDELLYDQKPSLEQFGLEEINVLYAHNFFVAPQHGDMTLPTNAKLAAAVDKSREAGLVTVLDIEHWPLKGDTEETMLHSVQNYLYVMQYMQAQLDNLCVGYYGVVPVRDFSRAKLPVSDPVYQEWVVDNDRVQPVADIVDAAFPSLYTITTSQADWLSRADAHVREARRLTGGPVYPFIWPNYHPQGGVFPEGTEIEPDFWRAQLDFCGEYADGFVLWGGNGQTWNEDATWWQITKQWISDNL